MGLCGSKQQPAEPAQPPRGKEPAREDGKAAAAATPAAAAAAAGTREEKPAAAPEKEATEAEAGGAGGTLPATSEPRAEAGAGGGDDEAESEIEAEVRAAVHLEVQPPERSPRGPSPVMAASPVPSEVEMQDDPFAGDKAAAAAVPATSGSFAATSESGSGALDGGVAVLAAVVAAPSEGGGEKGTGEKGEDAETEGDEEEEEVDEDEDEAKDVMPSPPVPHSRSRPAPVDSTRQLGSLDSIARLQARISSIPKVASPRKEQPQRAYSMRLSRTSTGFVVAAGGGPRGRGRGGAGEDEDEDDAVSEPGSARRPASGELDGGGGGGGKGKRGGRRQRRKLRYGTARGAPAPSSSSGASSSSSSSEAAAAAATSAVSREGMPFSLHMALQHVRRALESTGSDLPAGFDPAEFLDVVGAQWAQLDVHERGSIDRSELVARVWERLREDDDPAAPPEPLPAAVSDTVAGVMEAACGGDRLTFFDLTNLRLSQHNLYVRPPRSAARRFSPDRAAAWVLRQLLAKVADRDQGQLRELVRGIGERWAVLDPHNNGSITREALGQFVWDSMGGGKGRAAPDTLPAEMEEKVEQLMACSASGRRLSYWEFASITLTASGVDVAIRPL